MNIIPYLSYFHDGSVLLVEQNGGNLALTIESSQIPPQEVSDLYILSNQGTLRGCLYLYDVEKIQNENANQYDIGKEIENSEIMELILSNHEFSLDLLWNEIIDGRFIQQWRSYLFKIGLATWKNLPSLSVPSRPSIEDYQQYFSGGTLKGVHIDATQSLIEMHAESSPIDKEDVSQIGFRSTSRHTLLGTFVMRWVLEVRKNGNPIPFEQAFTCMYGTIDKLSIENHMVTLEVTWQTGKSERNNASNRDVIEFTVGTVWWRAG